MGKISKKFKTFLGIIGLGALAFGAIQAVNKLDENDIIDAQGGFHIHEVEEPSNVKFENNIISWDPSNKAEEYVVKYDGEKIKTKENSIDLNNVEPGTYDIQVKATAKGYRDSDYVNIKDCKILTEEQKTEEIINNLNEILRKDDCDLNDLKPIMLFKNNNIINYISGSRKNDCLLFSQIKISSEYENNITLGLKNNAEIINNVKYNIFSYDSHPNYEVGAPLVGNLKNLQYDGWTINKDFQFYDIIKNKDKTYTFKYLVIANCKKDNKSNYFIQTSNMVDKSEKPWIFDTFNKFNEGTLKNFAVEENFINLGDLLYYNNQYVKTNNNEIIK